MWCIEDHVEKFECWYCRRHISSFNSEKRFKKHKICETEIDKPKWSFSGCTIPNICSYHSSIFSDDCTRFGKYLDIGEGNTVPHGNASFNSVKIIIKPFQSRQENHVAFDKKLKMDVVNHLNLLHCWQNMQLQANIKGILKYVQWIDSNRTLLIK